MCLIHEGALNVVTRRTSAPIENNDAVRWHVCVSCVSVFGVYGADKN